nr:transcription factor bHLH104 isoform X2 [Elaeis guineensis]XP_019705513.1 transcription factor bHLH104 isoform X2 [Elaeis guineensis]XP_019705514.1 transcription factor bHLH104 isoform X2 [Elaeis guineensis]
MNLEKGMLLEARMPVKTDKCAVLNDAIRVLNELKAEAQKLKEANKKLEEDIKNLKEEKHELREEKSLLRAEKERMEDCVKALSISTAGYVPTPHAAYHVGVSKLIAFPSYGAIPMWQWIPPDVRDISKDHELRPPMA